MGGEALQLLRVLGFHYPLIECYASRVFLDLPKTFHFLAELMKRDDYWDLHYAVCLFLYPMLRLLRLADMRIGVMDKVYWYVLQVDRLLEESTNNVVEKWQKGGLMLELTVCKQKQLPKVGDKERKGKAKTEGLEDEDGEFVCALF